MVSEGARPQQSLSAHELASARDAAWEIMRQRAPSDHTREVYESFAHLNNDGEANLVATACWVAGGVASRAASRVAVAVEELVRLSDWPRCGWSGAREPPSSERLGVGVRCCGHRAIRRGG